MNSLKLALGIYSLGVVVSFLAATVGGLLSYAYRKKRGQLSLDESSWGMSGIVTFSLALFWFHLLSWIAVAFEIFSAAAGVLDWLRPVHQD